MSSNNPTFVDSKLFSVARQEEKYICFECKIEIRINKILQPRTEGEREYIRIRFNGEPEYVYLTGPKINLKGYFPYKYINADMGAQMPIIVENAMLRMQEKCTELNKKYDKIKMMPKVDFEYKDLSTSIEITLNNAKANLSKSPKDIMKKYSYTPTPAKLSEIRSADDIATVIRKSVATICEQIPEIAREVNEACIKKPIITSNDFIR